MLALGIEPDVVTMNLLIQAAGMEGRFDRVDQLYRQMRNIGPAPSSHTYVHLMGAFHNSHKKDPDWIFQVGKSWLSVLLKTTCTYGAGPLSQNPRKRLPQ